VDVRDRSLRPDEDAKVLNGLVSDREDRLLRFVDILRAEQIGASTVTEEDNTGFRRWRGPALVLAFVIVAIGVAVAFMLEVGIYRSNLAAGPALVQSGPETAQASQQDLPQVAEPRPPEAVAEDDVPSERPADPDPVLPSPGVPSLSELRPSEPEVAGEQAGNSPSTAPPAAVTTQSEPVPVLVPLHEADAPASPPPIETTAKAVESEAAKPVLRVYYPLGSSRGEASARSLSARIGPNVTSSDFESQARVPDVAVIQFSDERNHALARMIGKSLGDSGYPWRIQNTPSSGGLQRNMIEVWLPR
jgi:hypothetical protein